MNLIGDAAAEQIERRLAGDPERSAEGLGGYFRFRRGFVDEIRLPLTEFMEQAAALFAAHPITRVVLTDREPYGQRVGRNLVYIQPEPLPFPLVAAGGLRPREFFSSRRDALDALSAAAVAYGRRLAGLPNST